MVIWQKFQGTGSTMLIKIGKHVYYLNKLVNCKAKTFPFLGFHPTIHQIILQFYYTNSRWVKRLLNLNWKIGNVDYYTYRSVHKTFSSTHSMEEKFGCRQTTIEWISNKAFSLQKMVENQVQYQKLMVNYLTCSEQWAIL